MNQKTIIKLMDEQVVEQFEAKGMDEQAVEQLEVKGVINEEDLEEELESVDEVRKRARLDFEAGVEAGRDSIRGYSGLTDEQKIKYYKEIDEIKTKTEKNIDSATQKEEVENAKKTGEDQINDVKDRARRQIDINKDNVAEAKKKAIQRIEEFDTKDEEAFKDKYPDNNQESYEFEEVCKQAEENLKIIKLAEESLRRENGEINKILEKSFAEANKQLNMFKYLIEETIKSGQEQVKQAEDFVAEFEASKEKLIQKIKKETEQNIDKATSKEKIIEAIYEGERQLNIVSDEAYNKEKSTESSKPKSSKLVTPNTENLENGMKKIATTVKIKNSKLMIPLMALSKVFGVEDVGRIFGLDVKWDDATKTATFKNELNNK